MDFFKAPERCKRRSRDREVASEAAHPRATVALAALLQSAQRIARRRRSRGRALVFLAERLDSIAAIVAPQK